MKWHLSFPENSWPIYSLQFKILVFVHKCAMYQNFVIFSPLFSEWLKMSVWLLFPSLIVTSECLDRTKLAEEWKLHGVPLSVEKQLSSCPICKTSSFVFIKTLQSLPVTTLWRYISLTFFPSYFFMSELYFFVWSSFIIYLSILLSVLPTSSSYSGNKCWVKFTLLLETVL